MNANISPLLTHRIPSAHTTVQYYWSPSKKAFYQSNVHGADIPSDSVSVTSAQKESMLQSIYSGKMVSIDPVTKVITATNGAPPTREALLSVFNKPTEAHLDKFAATRGYRSIEAACSYVSSNNPQYKAEAEQAILCRDLIWEDYSSKMELYKADESLPIPTVQEFIASLPALSWD